MNIQGLTSHLAELTAACFYIVNVVDAPGMVLHSDCQWVIDGMEAGLEATGGALKMHADIWRKLHTANAKRRWPVKGLKVSSHASKTQVTSPKEEK